MDDAKTAVVTGASSGIGEAFARRLAGKGFDLALIARRRERLEALADELRQKSRAKVEVLVADLAVREEIHRVADRVRSIETLELLINNAGFGAPGDFNTAELAPSIEMINVHVLATTCLTHAALPGMVRRRRGAIINVSSVAAFLPLPHGATYCSTKSFVKLFSEAIAMEVKDAGVRVQALCPGYTVTGFHDTPLLKNFDRSKIPGMLWMSAEDVVSASLRALARNKRVCIPGFKNRLLVALLRNRVTAAIIRVTSRGRYRDI